MNVFSFYKEDTGEVVQFSTVFDDGGEQRLATMLGLAAIEGRPTEGVPNYVSNGQIIAAPDRPSAAHVFDYSTKTWIDPRDLDDVRAAQLLIIDAGFEAASAALTAGYPPSERLTWPTQQAEALAWQADSNAPTPFLDGIAAARGIAQQDMRQKTLENVLLFMGASQQLVGHRQKLKDEINAATSKEDIEAIVWSMPE